MPALLGLSFYYFQSDDLIWTIPFILQNKKLGFLSGLLTKEIATKTFSSYLGVMTSTHNTRDLFTLKAIELEANFSIF